MLSRACTKYCSQAWPNSGYNKVPTPGHNVSVAAGDSAYVKALQGKAYIARESEEDMFDMGFGPVLTLKQRFLLGSARTSVQ